MAARLVRALRPGAAGAAWRRPGAARRWVAVSAEPTPNPDSVMFHPDDREVLGDGNRTMRFKHAHDTFSSPLATALFRVEGVSEVMLAGRHVTVTKSVEADWDDVQPHVEETMSKFFKAGLSVVKEGAAEAQSPPALEEGSIEAQIVELLEERVRPFVQQDGGDVEFDRFDPVDGVCYVRMQGACSGCSKSSITLNIGIRNLMTHYIPEVKDIVNIEEEEEDIPRPGR